MSREIQICLAAAQLSISDANIVPGAIDPCRIGTSIGSDYILTTPDEVFEAVKACVDEKGKFYFGHWGDFGLPKMNPLWQLKYLPNMPASHISICNDFQGPSNSITLREASIGAVIGESIHTIQKGKVDLMLVGGTGSRIHPIKLIHAIQSEQTAQENVLPETASRPFDATRLGMVLGEGAGCLILEAEEHAIRRGAKIYAEVAGGTYTAALGHDFFPDRRLALKNAMCALFKKTNTSPDDVGHINAHGLATRSSDIDEAAAISDVFKDRNIPVTALKSYFGNLGAGSGAVELIAGVLALQNNQLFPILNHTMGDTECPIHPVREFGTPTGDSFVKLAATPQGQASAVLVRRI